MGAAGLACSPGCGRGEEGPLRFYFELQVRVAGGVVSDDVLFIFLSSNLFSFTQRRNATAGAEEEF